MLNKLNDTFLIKKKIFNNNKTIFIFILLSRYYFKRNNQLDNFKDILCLNENFCRLTQYHNFNNLYLNFHYL
jgi:hypothetical protein